MLIEVKHLTKRYGSHVAVKDLSFTIEKGTIYGFLGPNGAGKSTTMNILTGCLGATEGEVLIGGFSILDEPMKAKRLIGYLPEQPPVYQDMTVKEYLRFVSEAKGVAFSERKQQIAGVMEKTGLTDGKDRLIKNLSKGYRQRVGIAQALIGNPEIIILDEPTVGLDPTQIIEIRALISALGREHTVILSSHILSEVQAVCDTIMIISKGQLVASDTPENLTSLFEGTHHLKLEALCAPEKMKEILETVSLADEIRTEAASDKAARAFVTSAKNTDIREEVFRAFSHRDVPLIEMHTEHASLEDVFIELTREETTPDIKQKRSFLGKRKEADCE